MGSLVSVPKISTTPKRTYSTPSYSYTAAPTTSNGSSSTTGSGGTSTTTSVSISDSTDSAAGSAATTQADRESNLLRRNRGVAGTIRTGFRGLLGIADDTKTTRKTLLGE